jgi:DNA-binding response OmpR family regulator
MARVLIIEDETALRVLMREVLEKAGYDVLEAVDGEQGMRLFSEQPCEVVITDILMPNKEGLETILELSEQAPDVKMIAISGGGVGLGDDLLDMAKDFGAQYALRKPISMKSLVKMVTELLNE